MITIEFGSLDTGLEYFDLINEQNSARVFLQGAHIASFKKNDRDIIWMSKKVDYKVGTALRGGVPICWPWFGAHPEGFGAHGFARLALWQLKEQIVTDTTATLILELPKSQFDTAKFAFNANVELKVTLGEQLSVDLITTNCDNKTFEFTEALHSYFNINQIESVRTNGLEGLVYTEFGVDYPQQANNLIDKETDRVYQNVPSTLSISSDNGLIRLQSSGKSAVLWNPWLEKAKALSNFDDEDYRSMVCLENANIGINKVILAPQEQHTLSMIIE